MTGSILVGRVSDRFRRRRATSALAGRADSLGIDQALRVPGQFRASRRRTILTSRFHSDLGSLQFRRLEASFYSTDQVPDVAHFSLEAGALDLESPTALSWYDRSLLELDRALIWGRANGLRPVFTGSVPSRPEVRDPYGVLAGNRMRWHQSGQGLVAWDTQFWSPAEIEEEMNVTTVRLCVA